MTGEAGARVEVRSEEPDDIPAIRAVNDAAFGRGGEGRLVDRLRDGGKVVLSLVAADASRIVGHILFSRMTTEPPVGLALAGLAPMAVVPARQRQGVGTLLVREGLRRCAAAGLDVVIVIGHPGYYPRFGFVPAHGLGLSCEFDVPSEAFMAKELRAGAAAGHEALVRYPEEFNDI